MLLSFCKQKFITSSPPCQVCTKKGQAWQENLARPERNYDRLNPSTAVYALPTGKTEYGQRKTVDSILIITKRGKKSSPKRRLCMTTDAILEFRSDLSRYRDFFLKVSCPASPVDFSAHFTRGAVQVSGVPYVVLQNDASEVCIKHITGVSVLRQSDHCVYQFLCRDTRSNGKQTYHLVCSHPLKEKRPSSTPHSPL